MRILVRAGELRCRNDWGSDLWREKGAADEVLDVVMNETPGAERTPPRDNTDQLVAVARPAVTSAPMVSLSTNEPEESPEATERRVTNDLNSELVRRARQQFRDRQQRKGYAAEPVAPPARPERDAVVISNDYVPPSGRELRTESPIRFADRTAPDERFHHVPAKDEQASVPFRSQADQKAPRWTDDFENVSIRHLADPEPEPESPPFSQTAEETGEDDYPFFEQAKEAEHDFELTQHADADWRLSTRDTREWWASDEALIVSDDQHHAALVDEEAFESWSGVASEEPSPLPFSLWSEIPVCCMTCRDFRPAGDGGRGWCNNKWAFKHRRMVDADECPCETSIGHWWLPADAAWQGDLDVTAFGLPTPLMDKYFGRPGSSSDEQVIERRRRRS